MLVLVRDTDVIRPHLDLWSAQMIKLCECGCGEPAPIAKKTKAGRGHVKGQPIRFLPYHWGSLMFAPSTDEREIGWAVGIYEGEGSITLSNGRPVIEIVNTNRWVCERFQRIVGGGNLCGPYRRSGRNEYWRLVFSGWNRCARLTDLLWDDLSPRRQQQIQNVVDQVV